MRLNPHFLYNTLNAIAGLIGRDPAAATSMVTGLGDLFRRTLADRDADFIRLSEELRLAELYLRIQKLRFSDRLTYNLPDCRELHDLEIPPLLLQPLLENAVEHGVGSSEGNVHVDVTCEQRAGQICIAVRNSSNVPALGPRIAGTGIGIQNTRERLQAAFGASSQLDVESASRCEFLVRLRFQPHGAALVPPLNTAIS